MKYLPQLLSLFLLSSLLLSCSKDKDPVIPANVINSHSGLLIELEWSTGGSSSRALWESDLDLYLDYGNSPVEVSENVNDFEALHLRDVFKNGTYEVHIGAIEVSHETSYNLYISSPTGGVIHRYTGYFMPGEQGELLYMSIRKEGSRYTLLDL